MICSKCMNAGVENASGHYKRAAKYHDNCNDKGCVCQHRTGPGYVKREGSKVPLMQIQSP
jgi:hypothetical protein